MQRRYQLRRPAHQVFAVGVVQRELILARRHLIVDRQILRRLHIELDARHLGRRLLQLFNHHVGLVAALVERLQVNLQASAVEAGVAAVDADSGRDALHRRVGQHHLRQRLLTLRHLAKRDILRRQRDTLNQPGILRREEAFRHRHIEQRGERKGRQRHQQRQLLVIEHYREQPVIAAD